MTSCMPARRQADLLLFWQHVGGEAEDRHAPAEHADGAGGLQAVHVGHVPVHQDEVHPLLLEGANCLLPIGGTQHLQPGPGNCQRPRY